MAEVIAGAAIAGLLASLFYTSIHASNCLERQLVRKTQALRVIDNTLERLAGAEPDPQQVARALQTEFAACTTRWSKPTQARCLPTPAGLALRIGAPGRAPLAEVTIPWKQQ